MKNLAPYYGGKANKIGRFILQIMPMHRCYVEICGGMGSVLLNKRPAFQEVYNDINNAVFTLFKIVREKPKELEKLLNTNAIQQRRMEVLPSTL